MNLINHMKTIIKSRLVFPLLLMVLLVTTGCYRSSDHESVGERIKTFTTPPETVVKPRTALTIEVVKVTDQYQGGVYYTDARKKQISRFQCENCHLDENSLKDETMENPHGDVNLIHGEKNVQLTCYSCHNKKERNYLISEKETRIDFDHSYQKCSECHFRQKYDWTGGAHGKRLSLWAGERIIKNCTSCHSPHSPNFKQKWPATYSRSEQRPADYMQY